MYGMYLSRYLIRARFACVYPRTAENSAENNTPVGKRFRIWVSARSQCGWAPLK